MDLTRRIILVLVIAVVVTAVTVVPCSAQEEKKDKKDIWTEDEQRGPGPGARPGPGRGPGRGPRRFEPTEEEIERVMKGLQEIDPEKAKELTRLREKEPERFMEELRRHGREEFGKIVRERIDKWRRERQNEFLEWLGKNLAKEAQELAKLKEKDPGLYTKKYELAWNKYGRIFEEGRRNPELAEVLIEDLKLKKRQDELLNTIKAAKNEKEKQKLVAELEKMVARRFDLIVRRKQIEYERLLRWLKELRERVTESRDQIDIWRSDKFKNENVKKRVQDLLEETPKFSWD
ncbi:MAG: hypothetical protein ACETWQ_07650 [Phycisphaerae bacterium]